MRPNGMNRRQDCVDEVLHVMPSDMKYRQTSDISRTKSKNLNVSRLVLKMSLPLKPIVKSRMKM